MKFKVGEDVRINWEQVLIKGHITPEISHFYRLAVAFNALHQVHKIIQIRKFGDKGYIYFLDKCDNDEVYFFENELA